MFHSSTVPKLHRPAAVLVAWFNSRVNGAAANAAADTLRKDRQHRIPILDHQPKPLHDLIGQTTPGKVGVGSARSFLIRKSLRRLRCDPNDLSPAVAPVDGLHFRRKIRQIFFLSH